MHTAFFYTMAGPGRQPRMIILLVAAIETSMNLSVKQKARGNLHGMRQNFNNYKTCRLYS
jgi:hypothetical protein